MSTSIDKSTFVRGHLRGNGDITFAGRIEGDIAIDGELVIEASGLVGASVNATTVIARGAVRGDITATESITLENGARVVGNVRAPRITIEEGALVRGYVETGTSTGSKPAARATATAREAVPARVVASAPAPKVAPKAAPVPVPVMVPAKKAAPAKAVGRAPAPVVPALKKGAKAKRR